MKYECPCCGYKTFDEPPIGTFNICELCGWEADTVQSTEPDCEGGPNGICLREAQQEFVNSNLDTKGFEKSLTWQALSPPTKETSLKNSKINFVVSGDGTTKNV